MSQGNFGLAAGMIVIAILGTGCAATRSEVKLASPVAAPASTGPATGKVVVIRSVTDARVFEQAPRDPSVPSLGGEGAGNASADTKARAIGRKRNAYGMAMGDVMLEPGKTVEAVVRENLATALGQAGFQVRDSAAGGGAPLMIDVRIRKFWSWLTPGAFTMTVEALIETDLTPAGAAPIAVNVRSSDARMMVTDGAWIELVDKALQEYRVQVAAKAGAWR